MFASANSHRRATRVSYLSNSVIPSASANAVHVVKMCAALGRAGLATTLVHPANPAQELRNIDLGEYYGTTINFKRLRLRSPKITGQALVHALQAALRARMLHSHWVHSRDVFSAWYAMQLGIPTVLELHMPAAEASTTEKYLRKCLQHKRLVGVVVITEALKQAIQQSYALPEDLFWVLPDAADDTPAAPAQIERHGQLQVGYVGSLLPGKGLEMASQLPERCPWAGFHIVGGSARDVEQWEERLKHCSNVHFYGHVPPSTVPAYIASFDVVIAPNQPKVIVAGGSDIGQFTSPLKIFEYMAAGKAIIASDLEVLREVLVHGENAWLCDATSSENWTLALAHLRDNPQTAQQIGAQARQDFLQHYSWDARARNLIERVNSHSIRSITAATTSC